MCGHAAARCRSVPPPAACRRPLSKGVTGTNKRTLNSHCAVFAYRLAAKNKPTTATAATDAFPARLSPRSVQQCATSWERAWVVATQAAQARAPARRRPRRTSAARAPRSTAAPHTPPGATRLPGSRPTASAKSRAGLQPRRLAWPSPRGPPLPRRRTSRQRLPLRSHRPRPPPPRLPTTRRAPAPGSCGAPPSGPRRMRSPAGFTRRAACRRRRRAWTRRHTQQGSAPP